MKTIIFVLFVFQSALSFSQQYAWQQLNSGTTNSLTHITFINANTGFAVGNTGTIIKTTNSGLNWITLNPGPTSDLYSVKFLNENTGFAVGFYGTVIKTTDGGASWVPQQSTATNDINDIVIFDANNVMACKSFSIQWTAFIKSTNGGLNWINNITSGVNSNCFAIQFLNSQVGFGAGDNFSSNSTAGITRTTNGGASWQQVNFPNSGRLLSIHFPSQNTGYACGLFSSFFKTTDMGSSWNKIPIPDFCSWTFNSIHFTSENTGFIAGRNCSSPDWYLILRTTNGGLNWTRKYLGYTIPALNNLTCVTFVDGNTGFMCGSNGVILKTTSGGVIGISTISTIADKFSLEQNYPNPFNPSTIIKFSIAGKSYVELKVFNSLGSEVAVLASGEMNPGSYAADFDGSSMASGVYYYTITAGDFRQSRKMLLIK